MADTILVVVEQREGKLNRVSWETITAGRPLPRQTGWTLEAAVVGGGVSHRLRAKSRGRKSRKSMRSSRRSSSPTLPMHSRPRSSNFSNQQPKLVLMPHTYQVRDFVPKLATAMGRTVISDCLGFKHEGGKLLFTRQMFQGKFAADVSFTAMRHGS